MNVAQGASVVEKEVAASASKPVADAWLKSVHAMQLLLEKGVKVNSLDDCYNTSLTWLIYPGQGKRMEETRATLEKYGGNRRGRRRAMDFE